MENQKYKFMLYTRPVEIAKEKNLANIVDSLIEFGPPMSRYVAMIHKKEIDKYNHAHAEHLHVMIEFVRPFSIFEVADGFADAPHYFTPWHEFRDGVMYMLGTWDEKLTFGEVEANFDFHEFLSESVLEGQNLMCTELLYQRKVEEYGKQQSQ